MEGFGSRFCPFADRFECIFAVNFRVLIKMNWSTSARNDQARRHHGFLDPLFRRFRFHVHDPRIDSMMNCRFLSAQPIGLFALRVFVAAAISDASDLQATGRKIDLEGTYPSVSRPTSRTLIG